jgi:hypothetical protein
MEARLSNTSLPQIVAIIAEGDDGFIEDFEMGGIFEEICLCLYEYIYLYIFVSICMYAYKCTNTYIYF